MSMLNNEVALVTGASRGIGLAIALALGAAGARVIGTSTSAEPEVTALPRMDATARGVRSRKSRLQVLMTELESAGESPGILVNNAAITRDTLLLRMKPEDWDAVIATNLTSVFRLSKACVKRMMKERHGRIVNITSIVGVTGNAGQVNSAAAKAGLLGFTKSWPRSWLRARSPSMPWLPGSSTPT
jgi:3-oxoacyl-[acyl-carrier protein] reductase